MIQCAVNEATVDMSPETAIGRHYCSQNTLSPEDNFDAIVLHSDCNSHGNPPAFRVGMKISDILVFVRLISHFRIEITGHGRLLSVNTRTPNLWIGTLSPSFVSCLWTSCRGLSIANQDAAIQRMNGTHWLTSRLQQQTNGISFWKYWTS